MRQLISLVVTALAASVNASFDLSRELNDDELRSLGGFVYRPDVGTVVVIDSQSVVSENEVKAFPFYSRKLVDLPFSYLKMPGISVATAGDALTASKGNAAVILVDDPRLPMSLVAVEARWGIMNVAPLKADNPDHARFVRRAEKLFSRTSILVLGGSNQDFEASAMRPVTSLADLDALKGLGVAPFALPGLMNHVTHIGIRPGCEESYETACQEGWAPQPTNEYQKAIWDKIHTPPTKPIKITYDKAAQKPVVK